MKRGLRVESRLFVLPKEGAGVEECEDAAAADEGALAFAVADGATEAFDARRWARRLAEGWVLESPAPAAAAEFGAWVAAEGGRLQAEWAGATLPWYAEEKRRAGSFAAFVGVRFEGTEEDSSGGDSSGESQAGEELTGRSQSGGDSAVMGLASASAAAGACLRWRAVALGDSCLVQLRGGAIVAALPLDASAAFNSSPPLVPSAEALREAALARAVFREGEARAGDTFFLLSDAVAAWFFESRERGLPRLAEFDSLAAASENESLAEFVRRERRGGRMKDDDVAVLRIQVVGV